MTAEPQGRRGLWIGVALGTPLLLWGVRDAFLQANRTHPAELARWVVGCALVLDLVVLPVALLTGRAIGGRPRLRWAAATSATLALVAWPFVRGDGRRASNPSLLPRDYSTGLAVAVASVAAMAAVWWALDRWLPRAGSSGEGSNP